MQYCLEQGIPRSRWLTDWTPEDRALVVAGLLDKGDTCGLCGTAGYEWEEDPGAYAAIPHICRGCAAKDVVRADADTDRATPGSSIRLVPKEVANQLASELAAKGRKRPMSPRERKSAL